MDVHQAVGVDHLAQLLPSLGDLVDVGHVGHGAPGVEIGEDNRLVIASQDVGRLGHEVDAAEHDVVGIGSPLRQHGQAV